VLRQLVVQGKLTVDHGAWGALKLTDAARPVLRGEERVMLREIAQRKRRKKAAPVDTGPDAGLFEALRAWRRQAADERGVPPYVVLHDSTLKSIAASKPGTLAALSQIPGIGTHKLGAYGVDILNVLAAVEA
jgi:ATP-dependent DNA helicase RecQ